MKKLGDGSIGTFTIRQILIARMLESLLATKLISAKVVNHNLIFYVMLHAQVQWKGR